MKKEQFILRGQLLNVCYLKNSNNGQPRALALFKSVKNDYIYIQTSTGSKFGYSLENYLNHELLEIKIHYTKKKIILDDICED